jgi:hypothetical protein
MTTEVILGIICLSLLIMLLMILVIVSISKPIKTHNNPTWEDVWEGWGEGDFLPYLKNNYNPPTRKSK